MLSSLETPKKTVDGGGSGRRYTEEEKQQLLANLDLEVEHRTRQFEATLTDVLENFLSHQQGQILRVPRAVRSITMAEFSDKYNGDINACLRGLQKDRRGGEVVPDETSPRKRKWQPLQESPSHAESSRAAKTARILAATTPKRVKSSKPRSSRPMAIKNADQGIHRSAVASPSPSPRKFAPPFRPTSPTKGMSSSRAPSLSTFNPRIPQTPAYPRLPRKDENLMSVNGTPLAFPKTRDYMEPSLPEGDEDSGSSTARINGHKRANSIIVRTDPTFPHGSQGSNPGSSSSNSRPHSRTNSQSQSHSRNPSVQTQASSKTAASAGKMLTSSIRALVHVPTKDGHVLEFDPLITSPEELAELPGITDSAKKQAKQDMTLLIQSALAKWKI